jgi:hypothetical protein
MAKATVDYQEVFRNIDRINGGVIGAMKDGLDIALREVVDFIKVEYSRPKTGKGFTDRTVNLRNSIGSDSQLVHRGVVGVVRAKMDYAPVVETRHEGRFAFLWPGVNEKGDLFLERIGSAVKLII